MKQFIKNMTTQLELTFWQTIIPLLSRSKFFQTAITKCAAVYNNQVLRRQIAVIVMCSFAGFGTGMLAYSLSVILS